MKMTIQNDEGHFASYTDKVAGYYTTKSGYIRGDRCMCSAFAPTFQAKDASGVKSVDVESAFCTLQSDGGSLLVSLITGEGAIFCNAEKAGGGFCIFGVNKKLKAIESDTDPNLIHMFHKKAEDSIKTPEWKRRDNTLFATHGVALAFDGDFDWELREGDTLCIKTFGKCYIAFEDDENKAVEKVLRLQKEDGFGAHCKRVEEFLSQIKTNTLNQEFDEAVKWAALHAWFLCTQTKAFDGKVYSGLWAGLPWFRDNWGRDTFIALSGALLETHCLSEAKSVLLGFAHFQDLDKDSPTYGRIPNRYREGDDVIYNTVDGTLWFIRALYEYIKKSGDWAVLDEELGSGSLRNAVFRALEADSERCDGRGFLCHDEADTWMDARRCGGEALSPRGNRACDIEALWYTALKIGAIFAKKVGSEGFSKRYEFLAQKTKDSFEKYFVCPEYDMVADHLLPGGYGEWAPDTRVRPNQLFVITVPSVLEGSDADFVSLDVKKKILENVRRELLTPYGLYTLSPDDPLFHPHHETTQMYHKDSAYHNGTIWPWNSGVYISAVRLVEGRLDKSALTILCNEARLILRGSQNGNWCAGSLAENIHAVGDKAGAPILSGTFSQCWSLSEFLRNVAQDIGEGELPSFLAQCNAESLGNASSSLLDKVDTKLPSLSRDFWGSTQKKDYLMDLVHGGRMKSLCSAGENTACLEWWFDSFDFNSKYCTDAALGALYTRASTTFRLWAPTATGVLLILHRNGIERLECKKLFEPCKSEESSFGEGSQKETENTLWRGVWEVAVEGDLHNISYEYEVLVHGVKVKSIDPYAFACTENGNTGVVVDFERTNPEGWEAVKAPVTQSPNDAVIYELHTADLSASKTWGGSDVHRKRFLGVVEGGTKYCDMPTGFDYIKALGVTHVQLLPIFDFDTVDDTSDRLQYNWGYDPRNYGCLKGFYATNPYDATVRIREFKTLVQSFAAAGIGVIMDVVYNHMDSGLKTALAKVVPGYYFRVEGYSGAGEDTASEHSMFSRYMVDMTKFWLEQYKLCGYRFDLMGLHDTETMNKIADTLHAVKSDVLVYGEGWDMYRAGKVAGASMCNIVKMPKISHFNDAFRCAIKGPCNDDKKPGFVHNGSYRENIKAGLVGFTKHSQVDNSLVDLTANRGPWSSHTYTSMNYTEIHDNLTMNDKFRLVEEGRTEAYYEQLAKMAISLVLFSQGVPVIHAGQEALRTKKIPPQLMDRRSTFCSDVATESDGMTCYVRNSYNCPDGINELDWARIYNKRGLVEYVKLLIKLRKSHKAFRMSEQFDVSRFVRFIDNKSCNLPQNVIACTLDGAGVGDSWHTILLLANPYSKDTGYTLPARSVFTNGSEGEWFVATDGAMFCPEDCRVKGAKGEQYVNLSPKTVSVFYTK